MLDASFEACNRVMKEKFDGRYFPKAGKEEQGWVIFGFYDFYLRGIDHMHRNGNATQYPKGMT